MVLFAARRRYPAGEGRWHFDKLGEFIMTFRNSIALMLVALLLGGAAATAAETAKDRGVPKAVFADTTLTFPKVVDGTVITREFTVKNLGSADLTIDKVKTG